MKKVFAGSYIYFATLAILIFFYLFLFIQKAHHDIPYSLMSVKSIFSTDQADPCKHFIQGGFPTVADGKDTIEVFISCPDGKQTRSKISLSGLGKNKSVANIIKLDAQLNNFGIFIDKGQIVKLGGIGNGREVWQVRINSRPIEDINQQKVYPNERVEIVYR